MGRFKQEITVSDVFLMSFTSFNLKASKLESLIQTYLNILVQICVRPHKHENKALQCV